MQTSDTSQPPRTQAGDRMVPRISIHAFCEDPRTADALRNAASDRRLSKARLGLQMGGIDAAIDYYGQQVTPNLLIVETRQTGRAILAEVDRLANVCDPLTKVIVIGTVNDVELYRNLMHRGLSEYLVMPVEPLRIIEVIADLYVKPDAKPIGRAIAFVSARGGAGASTLAHNIGWSIAEESHVGTVIIDFDLPFGTLGLDFNADTTQGVFDALQAPERIDDVLLERLLVRQGDYLSLFSAAAMLDTELNFDTEAYEAVLDAARRQVPCIIADLPFSWSPQNQALMTLADDVVVVATPDLLSLRNAKNIIEELRLKRLNDPPPKLLLNQVGMPKRPEIIAKDFVETIGYEPFGAIPFDAELFGAAANNGQMIPQIKNETDATALAIRQTAAKLIGRQTPEAPVVQHSLLSHLKGLMKA